MSLLYSHFPKMSLQFANFYRSVFSCKVLRPFAFYFFEVQSAVLVFSSWQGENLLLAVIFKKGREELLQKVFLQNRKSCVWIRHLLLVRPRKLISVNFKFLYSM